MYFGRKRRGAKNYATTVDVSTIFYILPLPQFSFEAVLQFSLVDIFSFICS